MVQELKGIIRIAGADILGDKRLGDGLRRIDGVSFAFANAICTTLKMDPLTKAGSLSPEDIKKIESLIHAPSFPSWLFNRRKDYDTGKDLHLVSTDLKFNQENDIKKMKKIRSYKGMRHAAGLPVRGQSTKAHFRHGKAIGVKKGKKGKKG